MDGKIALEEHFAIEETLGEPHPFAPVWPELSRRLLNADTCLVDMDANGIEMMVMSLNAPAVQGIPNTATAIGVARKANDRLAEVIARHPTRFAGFAALPMQDPDAAAAELTRCVRELGFVGALVNGFSQVGSADNATYYDGPAYRPFWRTVEALDVPFYLHPRMNIPSQSLIYEGHPWLRSAPWGFAVETSTHALRLCGSGLFDDFPNLRIITGHLGEGIPFGLWRIDARMRFSPRGYRGKRPLGDYFREHFHITTSGNFNDAAFRCTLEMMGADRLYFSADYPFERMEDAANWFDSTPVIDDEQRQTIGRENAIKLFDLDM